MIPPLTTETIFHAARARASGERPAYLDDACGGDAALRAHVEALLKADAEAGDFLVGRGGDRDAGPSWDEDTRLSSGEQAGDTIDRYRLLRQIGEGGFGAVWMAEQQEPVRRKVALKVLKLGMDTRRVTARFEQERQALAMMDHPHIAKVFDAGATKAGRPYFVMELVEGAPIADYCDQHHLTIDERLMVFAQVCHAVQHAHGRGIIHRDLKPSNVLVGSHDGRPHAKVIDFGIAKATSPSESEKARFTEQRQVIGTLLYMSPEQAEGLPDIDTRTDVYSLGALLYELLVGEPPFSREELQNAGMLEVQRILREVEPKRPSTRISDSHDQLANVAAQRKVEPRRLGGLVRGDLDWIVMKALEKDRSRRYETVNGLVMDIHRHLSGEPVTAAPPSAAYRLRKFVRRNRVAVIAGATVALALVLGIAGTSYGMIEALGEKRRADLQAGKAIAAASMAEKATAEEAETRLRAEAIAEFVIAALDTSDPRKQGSQEATILGAMENAIRDIESGRFKDDPELEARLQSIIAMILQNNGRAEPAEPLLEQALGTMQALYEGDHPDVARMLNDLAIVRSSLGRAHEAVPLLELAVGMTRRLAGGDDRDVARDICNLARAKEQLNRFAEATELYEQALAMTRRLFPGDDADTARTLNGLALVEYAMGLPAEAERRLVEALEMNRRVYQGDHADVALILNNLANVESALGRAKDAESRVEESLAMFRRLFKGDHPEVANGINNLALFRQRLDRSTEAEELFVESLEMHQRLFPGGHPATANVMNNLASARKDLGRATEAEALYEKALAMAQQYWQGDHQDVVKGFNNLASTRLLLNRPAEAEPLFVKALEMCRKLYQGDHPSVALGLHNLANAHLWLGRSAEAEPRLVEALEMKRRLCQSDHPDLPPTLICLAAVRHKLGKKDEARELFAAGVDMARRLSPDGSVMLARVMFQRASVLLEDGEPASALPDLEAAVEMAGKLLPPAHPQLVEYEAALAECRAALGK